MFVVFLGPWLAISGGFNDFCLEILIPIVRTFEFDISFIHIEKMQVTFLLKKKDSPHSVQ